MLALLSLVPLVLVLPMLVVELVLLLPLHPKQTKNNAKHECNRETTYEKLCTCNFRAKDAPNTCCEKAPLQGSSRV